MAYAPAPRPAAIRDDTSAITDALTEAAAAAGLAPSIHNTQPWRWRLAGQGLDLPLEPSRLLQAVDPGTRLRR